MNTWLKRYAFASMLVGASASSTFAAESVAYKFGDWRVTVTPRDSQSAPLPKADPRAAKSSVNQAAAIEINPQRKLDVVPVAFQKEVESLPAPPMPMPDAAEPAAQPQPQPSAPANELPALQPNSAAPEIVPQRQAWEEPVITPKPSNPPLETVTTVPMALLYRDVYKSIPFSRVEYNNYHGYRHDATMAFLFNQMPTTIINRNSSPTVNYDYYGPGYGYMGYPYYDPPAYPFSYGLRIHRSR